MGDTPLIGGDEFGEHNHGNERRRRSAADAAVDAAHGGRVRTGRTGHPAADGLFSVARVLAVRAGFRAAAA